MEYRRATVTDAPMLASMNWQLIQDEGHRNPMTVTEKEGQRLAWVRPNRLREYPMPPADVPLVAHLMTLL